MIDILKQEANRLFLKHKLFILPTFSILLSLVFIFTAIIPNIRGYGDAKKKTDELNEKKDFFAKKIQILSQIDEAQFKDDIQSSLISLPDDKEIPSAINQILFLVSTNELALEDINFSSNQPETSTQVSSFQIKLDITGNTQSIKNFISGLNKIPRFTRVLSLEMSGGRNPNKTQVSMILASYFQQLPTSIGSIDAPIEQLTEEDLQTLASIKALSKQASFQANQSSQEVPIGKVDPFN